MPLDPSGDFAVFDGTETVTFRQKVSSVVNAGGVKAELVQEHTIKYALRMAPTERETVLRGGGFRLDDAVWQLPVSQFPAGVKPQEGDEIIEADGTLWRVMYTGGKTLTTRYRCWVRRP